MGNTNDKTPATHWTRNWPVVASKKKLRPRQGETGTRPYARSPNKIKETDLEPRAAPAPPTPPAMASRGNMMKHPRVH